jgi:hypothetical protein
MTDVRQHLLVGIDAVQSGAPRRWRVVDVSEVPALRVEVAVAVDHGWACIPKAMGNGAISLPPVWSRTGV